MEIFATILLFVSKVALRVPIKLDISGDGNVPEDEEVGGYQNNPVEDEFSLLLLCDLCSCLIESFVASVIVSIN